MTSADQILIHLQVQLHRSAARLLLANTPSYEDDVVRELLAARVLQQALAHQRNYETAPTGSVDCLLTHLEEHHV